MKSFFNTTLASLLSLLFCFAFCNGQVKTESSTRNTATTQTTQQPQSKIVRTQGAEFGGVGCELVDKDGHIWFSISGEGVYRYDGRSFTHFTTRDGLCSNNVGPIIQGKSGNILLGSDRGICRYDGKAFTKYPVPETLGITCLFEDRAGDLWFGTTTAGIYRFDGKKLDNFLNNDRAFNLGNSHQFILDILQDRKGNLWFSSWNGGGVWRYDGRSFTNFLPSADYYRTNQDRRNPDPLPSASMGPAAPYRPSQHHIADDMIFSMMEDKAGNIWFATRNHGVCRYDGKTFTSVWEKEGFKSGGAYRILEDRKGNLWFTTEEGVWRFDGKSFKHFTQKDGLVNNAVTSILEDREGNLWFGTKWFGLSRYDGKRFVTFSEN